MTNDDHLIRLVNGEVVQVIDYFYDIDGWHDTIFDAYDYFDNPEYRWWGIIDTWMVYFTDTDVCVKWSDVMCSSVDENGYYAFVLSDGYLAAATPTRLISIMAGVLDVIVAADHFLVWSDSGIWVLDASPYDLCSGLLEDVNYIRIGEPDDDLGFFLAQLSPRQTGKTLEELIRDFDIRYGITFNGYN